MNSPSKRKHYEYLFDRIESALDSEFYLDAAWIAHAILEDRLDSAIRNSSASKAGRLSSRIDNLQKAMPNDLVIKGAFHDDLLDRIDDWRKKRNTKTHELAEEIKPVDKLTDEFQELAETGEGLARDAAAAVMRLKNIKDKN